MTLEEFLSGVREFTVWVAENDPELNYIAGTGVALATDGTVSNHLLNTHANISESALNDIAAGWNYADAASCIITAGDLLLQNGLDEVNNKKRIENYAKAAILNASAASLISMTLVGMGPWGFVVSTVCDFSIAVWDFYKNARKYWDFDYWFEEQLCELYYLSRKIYEIDGILEKELIEDDNQRNKIYDQLENYITRKNNLIEDIKVYSTYYFYQKLQDSNLDDKRKYANQLVASFNLSFNKAYAKQNLVNIHEDDRNSILNQVSTDNIQTKPSSDMSERAQNIKESLKNDTKDKGIKLTLKTFSMVGMTLLAVGAVCHPIGLAITASVAAGYLLYSFGFPAAKKLWNRCFESSEKMMPTNLIYNEDDSQIVDDPPMLMSDGDDSSISSEEGYFGDDESYAAVNG
ncbi:hypothetical protein L3V83_10430 [Thiotrichales bacterium 19X7-9]|nr:hypothetical protein [Thiotrichales bacterium 19X7-9]